MRLSKKDLIAITIAEDYQKKSSIDYLPIIERKIGLLLELMETLVEEKGSIEPWKCWSEALIQKLCTHSAILLNLFSGTKLPFGKDSNKVLVLDQPSILILLRSIVECYLTCYYLYFDNVSEDEKKFRMSVWRYSGINQRSLFDIKTEYAKEKQVKEKALLDELKLEVEASSYFQSFKKDQKKEILKGVKPRLFNSWQNLIVLSGLRVELFKNIYGYKSSYSHSEFISILQVKDGILKFKKDDEVGFELFLLHFIISKLIIDVANFFPSIKKVYSNLPEELRFEIEILETMSREKPTIL